MCLYGDIGGGKTLYAVKEAVRYMQKGWYVFTNFPLRYATIISYPAFVNYNFPKNSLIVIDEANIWFNSREWKKLTLNAMLKFTQSRKLGYDIIYTTQRPEAVDVQLRDITTIFCKVEGWFILSLLKWHSKANFSDNEKRKYDLGITPFFPKLYTHLFKLYDTYALVRPDLDFPPMDYLSYWIYYNEKIADRKDFSKTYGKDLIVKRPIDIKRELSNIRLNRSRVKKIYFFPRALLTRKS
jgi:hypothetical protein